MQINQDVKISQVRNLEYQLLLKVKMIRVLVKKPQRKVLIINKPKLLN